MKSICKYTLGIILVAPFILIMLDGCRKTEEKAASDKPILAVPYKDMEHFHADNDIAMTVRSLADALKVGEPLDSTFYDFEGVLTDGQGTPLYTDVQGAPGQWVVDVLDVKNVMIRNLYLGDLLPDDLENYILQSLRLSKDQELLFNRHEAVSDDETEISVYDCGGVYLRFEVRAGIAPNGLEGPQLNIIMSSDLPAGAEKQTDVSSQTLAMQEFEHPHRDHR